MIKGTFALASEVVEVIIKENELLFYDVGSQTFTTIEGLKLDLKGVIKEFPELEGNDDWKKIAISRLKEKIKSYNTELEKIYYVKDELIKYGYKALFIQRAGFRPERFK